MAKLTTNRLKNLKDGAWASDGGPRGGGTLCARRLTNRNVLFYFRYTDSVAKRHVIPLGAWEMAGGSLTLEGARDKAYAYSQRYRAGDKDLAEVLEGEAREAQRERAVAKAAEEAKRARESATLAALLDAYVIELQRDGKASAKAVAAAFLRHVKRPWPQLVQKPADDITLDDLLAVVGRLVEGEKLREAGKLRSYLQAAYNAAIKARQSAQASPALRALKIATNPVRELAPLGGSEPRERALSAEEFGCYWRRLCCLNGPIAAALRFHVLTGGQRLEQLRRVTLTDVNFGPSRPAMIIRDRKGPRKVPRLHEVPLTESAIKAMNEMAPRRLGQYVFTVTAGLHGVAGTTLNEELATVVEAMTAAGELPGGRFTLGDIRRTVETRLAAQGVSREERGQLQSHGLSGVQARHYNKHDYYEEKKSMLMLLEGILKTYT